MTIADTNAELGGAARVLLADDDITTLFLLQRTLEKWGFKVFTASDGDQAMAITREHDVRLVVSDWEMPGLSGPELCRQIRANDKQDYTYILLLTARKDTDSVVQGLEAGANDFVTKPFDGTELRARMAVGQRMLALHDRLKNQQETLKQLNQRLSNMAYMDPLMSVGNRRAFHDAVEETHDHARERGASYGLIMADVDHFKAFNDSQGHQAGDRALAGVARALRLTLRGGDQLFRYGGEELVVVTRTKTTSELASTAERLRNAVERMGLEHPGSLHGRVTCSFGAVQVGGAQGGGGSVSEPTKTWAEEVERADQALYRAKAQGRNRVAVWNKEAEQAA